MAKLNLYYTIAIVGLCGATAHAQQEEMQPLFPATQQNDGEAEFLPLPEPQADSAAAPAQAPAGAAVNYYYIYYIPMGGGGGAAPAGAPSFGPPGAMPQGMFPPGGLPPGMSPIMPGPAAGPGPAPGPVPSFPSTATAPIPPQPSYPMDGDPVPIERQPLEAEDASEVPVDELLADRSFFELERRAQSSNDPQLAITLAWQYYTDRRYVDAGSWFSHALNLNQRSGEAAYGLALTYYQLDQLTEAEALVRWRFYDHPEMGRLFGDLLVRKAITAYENEEYELAQAVLMEAAAYRSLTYGEREILAWTYYHDKEYAQSTEMFEAIYRATKSDESAEGLYVSLNQSRQTARLERLAGSLGGPLARRYRRFVGQRYIERGQLLTAYRFAPDEFPELANVDTSWVALGGMFRDKSGFTGLGELRHEEIPIFYGGLSLGNGHTLSARVASVNLSSGTLPNDALVGSAVRPISRFDDFGVETFEIAPFRFEPTLRVSGLTSWSIRYQHRSELSPYFEFGATPQGGPVSSTFTGRLGVMREHEKGYWFAELSRQSIKESILSYVGLRDPFFGGRWGRVTETGLNLGIYRYLDDDLAVYAAASGGVLKGEGVDDNQHFSFTVALNKELNVEGFEYFTFGPAVSFDRYSENLSRFTLGHGGYFSPSSLAQATMNVQFQTPQGQSYLVQGMVAAGFQSNRQAEAQLFPLNPDGRFYPAEQDSSAILTAQLRAVVELGNRWHGGGMISFNQTANYDETIGLLFLRYLFEPRTGLYSMDLPGREWTR